MNERKVLSLFSKYSGVSFKTGKTAFDFPERYANIGALPLEGGKNVG